MTRDGASDSAGNDDVATAIESNVAAFLLQMGAAGGGEERSDDQVTWTVGGSPIGYHNAVVRFAVDRPELATELVERFVRELRTRALPGSWHLSPTMRPAELDGVLIAAGFQDGGDEPAMAAELPALVEAAPTDLAISRVGDAGGMRDYHDVLAAGFGEGPKEADWVASVFSRIGYGDAWSHYVGRIHTRPVATASLLMTQAVGGIYFVCTAPQHRRQGYGAAITRHLMSEAASRGASHAILGSSPMGQRVYEGLGFRTIFAYRLLEWEP